MPQEFKKYESSLQALYLYINGYTGMSPEQFLKLSGYFTVRHFDRRTAVVKSGEVDHFFNYIIKGVARKYILAGKKEITLQLSTENHFIHSELSFHTGKPSECIVEAIEPCVFLSLHKDDLEKLYVEMPELNKLARIIIGEMYIRKELRDLSHVRLNARERFLQYMHSNPDMLQRVPQKYIASFLNIKPETFSRLKHLLRTRK
ncbi:Crp/Fnr family transcriptional regulator [Flavihumibacter stibioxidans]|uniref:Cyclic nucleotide-binding domain-containing protein n=1 Tax=Flavihumibacter stibioxidans TaxID=1834163 RepID=A0ABR7MDM6_9BACT|nr:Crp/Fnr family transcriptional regulator [Flavihumibacter stibioxidans]MBC6493061.1 hypothetical protein [Flavihumibacter stibioxidans]